MSQPDRSESRAAASEARELRSSGRGFDLFRVLGVRVSVDYSWFFVFLLVLWVLSYIHLPSVHPDQPVAHFWFAGTIATLLFFASVLAHELSHSLVARALGLEVLGITLFIFGGVSRLAADPKDAWTEIKVAVAGPLMSFFLGGFFFALFMITAGPLADSPLVPTVFGYLAFVNFALGVFNLIPGVPLDGGRVLRAVLWLRTGSMIQATRAAALLGQGIAVRRFLGRFGRKKRGGPAVVGCVCVDEPHRERPLASN
jgi:Zn-dependent protease